MNAKAVIVLGGSALAAFAVFVVWFLFAGPNTAETSAADQLQTRRTATEKPSVPVPLELEPTVRSESTSHDAKIRPDEVSGTLVPDSYRERLCGVRGRLIEQDGIPVPGLEVILLELDLAAFAGSFGEGFRKGPGRTELEIARALSDRQGEFVLARATANALHGLGISLGGPRASLRLLDVGLRSGETIDLGDIVLSPSVSLTGQVVDESGQGIAGARVRATLLPSRVFSAGVGDLRSDSRLLVQHAFFGSDELDVFEIPEWLLAYEFRLPIPMTTTDSEGRFTLNGAPQGLINVVADHPGFVAGVTTQPTGSGKTRDVGRIQLEKGARLSGYLVNHTDQPLAGFEVIGGSIAATGFVGVAQPANGLTDENGRFAVDGVVERGPWHIGVRRRGTNAWHVHGPFADGEFIAIALQEPLPFEVALEDWEGNPVAGADLQIRVPFILNDAPLLPLNPPRPIKPEPTVLEPGRLRVEGYPQGEYLVVGRAEGFAVATTEYAHEQGQPPASMVFAPATTLSVRVVAADDGEPLPKARVAILPEGRGSLALDQQETDATGIARLRLVPTRGEAPIVLFAQHPGFATAETVLSFDRLRGSEPTMTLTLDHGGTLAGRVHNGGVPPEDRVLVAVSPRGGSHLATETPRVTVTDAEGFFKLTDLREGSVRYEVIERFLQSDPNAWLGAAIRGEFEPESIHRGQAEITTGRTTELDIDLRDRILGLPARLVGQINSTERDSRFQIRIDGDNAFIREVAAGEYFEFNDLKAGPVTIQISRIAAAGDSKVGMDIVHSEWTELAAGEVKELKLDLEPFEVEVVVNAPNGGEAVPNARLRVHRDGRIWGDRSRRTNQDGRVTFWLVEAGNYAIHADHPDWGIVQAEVVLPDDAPVELVLDPGVPCAGRIRYDAAQLGVDEEWVFLNVLGTKDNGHVKHMGYRQLKIGEAKFRLLGLAPGTYQAQLYASKTSERLEFVLPDWGDQNLTLDFAWRD